jgi:RNA polymerase sigma factor (sigma-70 family)
MLRVQEGDHAAYRALFERHHGRVYGFLLRKTRDPQAAADLYQESLLRVYRSRARYTPGRPFRPWLFGIALNAARDRARQLQRVAGEGWPSGEVASGEGPGTSHPDTRIHLEAAIAAMPENLRDAFLLGVVEGFDHNEVAALLDIEASNARARISRGRAWLRDWLGGSA